MVWTASQKSGSTTQALVERILASGQMSRREHIQLTSEILSDQRITEEERRLINRVFDYVQTGRLRVVD